MLKAAAVEAVAEYNGRTAAAAPVVKPDSVRSFMAEADKGQAQERAASGNALVVTRDRKDSAVYEARDEKSNTIVHRAYVKKY